MEPAKNANQQLHIGYVESPESGRKNKLHPVIREADPATELPQILKFYTDTYGETDFLEEDTWHDVAKMKNLIAMNGEEFLGCATWTEQEDRIFLLAVLVVPKYFRSGIGTALLEKIKEIAKDLQKPKIFVPMSNDDLVSYVFYHRNGFKLKGIDVGLPEKRHGKEETGFWGLPCRDEFYFEYVFEK